jgi:hypothetical protein
MSAPVGASDAETHQQLNWTPTHSGWWGCLAAEFKKFPNGP